MSFSHLFLACLSLPTALSQGVLSGCPSYGCTPSGSFSLLTSSGIPRSGVKVIWSVKISNSTGTGSPLLGCVSNSNHLVCPTPQGYVGVNADNGKILWNRTILDNPSLPIMDVYGDVIGSDGKHLVKVDGDGTVEQPIIPLDPQMVPIYSVEYADEYILLLVSETGELVAYLTNGIPLANLFLRGNVQNYNGTFHPIAQPVMNGSRAYVLTQFRPEPSYTDIPREKRLFAVDITASVEERMRVAWSLRLDVTSAAVVCKNSSTDDPVSNMLIFDGTVFISYTSSVTDNNRRVICKSTPMFSAIKDAGNHGNMLYTFAKSPSTIAVFDNSLRRCQGTVQGSVLWLTEHDKGLISAVDPGSGKILTQLRLDELLNVSSASVTSKVMAFQDPNDKTIILIFSVLVLDGKPSNQLVAMELSVSERSQFLAKILWAPNIPIGSHLQGQITLVDGRQPTFVASAMHSSGIYLFAFK